MKIPVHIATKLLQLSEGNVISASAAKHPFIEELVLERIIERNGRIQKTLQITNNVALFQYLNNKFGINDLNKYIEICLKEIVKRSDLVEVSSDSKLKKVRTFKGFLVNSYVPINATFNSKPITLNFTDGIFQFVYDFSNFIPEENVTIVGVENAENFRFIENQKQYFKNIKPLFVSRYPQNQSKDLIKWLKSISNSYLHFGDFDFAGIGIYLNEFKKHISGKSDFFVPENIENLISKNGSKDRFNQQKINFDLSTLQEEKLAKLIHAIQKHKKGLDQEILINN